MDTGGEISTLRCGQCDRQFGSQRSLRCHVKIHNERTLKCCFCNLMFNRTDTLFLHVLDHVTKEKIECYAENCSETVSTVLDGEKHAFVAHNDQGMTVLKCRECAEHTPNFRKMLYHYTFKHGQLKEFAEEMIVRQKEYLRLKKNGQRKGAKRTLTETETEGKEEEHEEEEEEVEGEEEENDEEPNGGGEGGAFEKQLNAAMADGETTEEILGKLSDVVADMFPLDGTEFYQCTHCKLGFSDAILWMIHLGFHDVDEPFKCTGCQRTFENRQTFVIHLTYFAHGSKEENEEKEAIEI